MDTQYTICISTEVMPDQRRAFVGIVQENGVSSYGYSKEEALDMTVDALIGVLTVEQEMIYERIS